MPTTWSPNDRVLHPTRPDWGVGVVTRVAAHAHGGVPAQRLTIRFDGAGLKTLSTALVNLKPADNPQPFSQQRSKASGPQEQPTLADLSALPQDITPPLDRPALTRALNWYRHTADGRALLDWAIARSALRDPLSVMDREHLRLARDTFFKRLDHIVLESARALARKDPAAFQSLTRSAPPAARSLLQRGSAR